MFMNEEYNKKDSLNFTKYKMVDLPGSKTTRNTKPMMVDLLMQHLDSRNIIFYYELLQAQLEFCNLKRDIKIEIEEQLRNFSKHKKHSRDPEIGTRITFHGKSHGGNDDFVMGIMINLYNALLFFTKEQYKNERKEIYLFE